MSFEGESRSAKVFRAVHTQYNTCKILVLSKVGFLTLLYGLQSSSANRWWILASVKSFLEGLYSNSWRSIFQPASSWLQLGLEGERMRLHFYDGHLKIDTQCFRGGFAVQSRYNADLSSVMLLGQCVYRVSHGASTLPKQLVNRVNVLRDIGWKTVGSYPSHLLYFYDLWLNFLRKIILENLLFHRVLIIIWNWYRIFSFSIIFKI